MREIDGEEPVLLNLILNWLIYVKHGHEWEIVLDAHFCAVKDQAGIQWKQLILPHFHLRIMQIYIQRIHFKNFLADHFQLFPALCFSLLEKMR